jgi:hypothetical protein
MPVPASIVALFGWRGSTPNIADGSSSSSVAIASRLFEQLGVTRDSAESGQTMGSGFEAAVMGFLADELATGERGFEVGRQIITAFAQYRHLARIEALLAEADPDGTLRSELGSDYLIKPDVTVGLPLASGELFLHAAISCKWTIRSDRVQNIRHEGVILGRHRRGRQPHVVTVTSEPLPSRLAAIARGTGEVDCVYHVALEELLAALTSLEAGGQRFGSERDAVEELVLQDRLRPLDVLPEVLAHH